MLIFAFIFCNQLFLGNKKKKRTKLIFLHQLWLLNEVTYTCSNLAFKKVLIKNYLTIYRSKIEVLTFKLLTGIKSFLFFSNKEACSLFSDNKFRKVVVREFKTISWNAFCQFIKGHNKTCWKLPKKARKMFWCCAWYWRYLLNWRCSKCWH